MAKQVLMVLSAGFEDVEAVAVIDVLNRAGIELVIASLENGPVPAAYGTVILTHSTLAQTQGIFDAIVFPGGKANAEALARNPLVKELILRHWEEKKIIAAICAAPATVLGEAAGILRGKHVSGDPGTDARLIACGAILAGRPVAVDGNIITAAGPGSALEFALTLAQQLAGPEPAAQLAKKWGVNLAPAA